ncbi:hypothetical protein BDZ91DRAFT_796842 [Kalaharituber pfeilii]|nr:hypothetical protein BDZ91DRAFT_796842 [Kalaharituber pfeilii]
MRRNELNLTGLAGPIRRREMSQNELNFTRIAGPIQRRELSQNELNFKRIAGAIQRRETTADKARHPIENATEGQKDTDGTPPPPTPAAVTTPPPTRRNTWGELRKHGIGWGRRHRRGGDPRPSTRPDSPGLQVAPPPQTLGLSPIQNIDTEPTPPTPPQPLGLSPITNVDTKPTPPQPQTLGLSPGVQIASTNAITAAGDEPNQPHTHSPGEGSYHPKVGANKTPTHATRKRKARPASPTTKTTPEATPAAAKPTLNPRPETRSPTPRRSDSPLEKKGIVVHGIALRKDLGNVRRWLETDNIGMGRITGIRWLRKKSILLEEGKKTSSVVVYLETPTETGKVWLGGRWLNTSVYETDRGRK